MENKKRIRNLRDVFETAQAIDLKCRAFRIDEIHARGYYGVKLIVGVKENIAFEASADPNKPGLTREQRLVEAFKAKITVPDVRILWIAPGTTADELAKNMLMPIKESLEKRAPIIDPRITTMKKQSFVDEADIAAKIASGEEVGFEAEDDDIDEIGEEYYADADGEQKPEPEIGEPSEPFVPEDEGPRDESDDTPAWAKSFIKSVGENMESLGNGISELNDEIGNISERVSQLEGSSKNPKGKGKRKK